jgi:hypothetical protein
MTQDHTESEALKSDFVARYEWRKKFQFQRFQELYREGIIGINGGIEKVTWKLLHYDPEKEIHTAYRRTLFFMWGDVQETYIFGQFMACILVCGALAERCLKLDYIEKQGGLPDGRWTLGQIINKEPMKSVVDKRLIELASELLGSRNSMAHALLEHRNPVLASLGGPAIRTPLSDHHHIIEPYRQEALEVLKVAANIMLHQFSD